MLKHICTFTPYMCTRLDGAPDMFSSFNASGTRSKNSTNLFTHFSFYFGQRQQSFILCMFWNEFNVSWTWERIWRKRIIINHLARIGRQAQMVEIIGCNDDESFYPVCNKNYIQNRNKHWNRNEWKKTRNGFWFCVSFNSFVHSSQSSLPFSTLFVCVVEV